MRYWLAILMATVLLLPARPSLAADPLRYPFLPHVVVGAAPFCAAYAQASAEDFKPGTRTEPADFGAPSLMPASERVVVPAALATRQEIERITGKPPTYPDWLYDSLYLVDLDGSGVPEAVFTRQGYQQTVIPFTDWFIVENVPADALAELLDRFAAEAQKSRSEFDPKRFGASVLYENGKGVLRLEAGMQGSNPLASVGQLALVSAGGKLYWQVWVKIGDPGYRDVMFFETRTNVSARLACAVRLRPELRAAAVHEGPAYRAFQDVLRPVLGRGSSTAESCMSGSGALIAQANDLTFRMAASFQPWRASPEAYPPGAQPGAGLADDHQLANILRLWSYQSAWNRRQYGRIVAAFEPAVTELTGRYVSSFGVDEATADDWARRVAWRTVGMSAHMTYDYLIDTLTNEAERFFLHPSASPERLRARLSLPRHATDPLAGFRTPASYDKASCSRPDSGCGRGFTEDEMSDALRFAALDGYPADVLELLVSNGAGLEAGEESALMLAVERPETVSLLLRAGASVRFRNPFGKTPLMMAAHMGRTDSVRLVLDGGAQVDAATYEAGVIRPPGVFPGDGDVKPTIQTRGGALSHNISCAYGPAIGRRTALMYAAENGSPDLIALLIERGAEVSATDSQGRTVADYLARNETLSETERRRAASLLSRPR